MNEESENADEWDAMKELNKFLNCSGRYVLDENGNPKPEPDLLTWGRWFENGDRIVKQQQVGRFWISTVFLGLDHGWGREGGPVLWETMVFGPGQHGGRTNRCSGNREQAEGMHDRMVKLITRYEGIWVDFSFLWIVVRHAGYRIDRIYQKLKPYWCRWFHGDHWKLGSIGPTEPVVNKILCIKCHCLPFYGKQININVLNRIKRE